MGRMSQEKHDHNSTVLDRQTDKAAPPPMFQVVLLNDDYPHGIRRHRFAKVFWQEPGAGDPDYAKSTQGRPGRLWCLPPGYRTDQG